MSNQEFERVLDSIREADPGVDVVEAAAERVRAKLEMRTLDMGGRLNSCEDFRSLADAYREGTLTERRLEQAQPARDERRRDVQQRAVAMLRAQHEPDDLVVAEGLRAGQLEALDLARPAGRGRCATQRGDHAVGHVLGPDRLVGGATAPGDGHRRQQRHPLQQRQPPIAGVLVFDYLILKRTQLDVPALFTMNGRYRYWGGFNLIAVAWTVFGFLFYMFVVPATWIPTLCTIAFTGVGYTLTVMAIAGRSRILQLGSEPAEAMPAAAD